MCSWGSTDGEESSPEGAMTGSPRRQWRSKNFGGSWRLTWAGWMRLRGAKEGLDVFEPEDRRSSLNGELKCLYSLLLRFHRSSPAQVTPSCFCPQANSHPQQLMASLWGRASCNYTLKTIPRDGTEVWPRLFTRSPEREREALLVVLYCFSIK